MSGVEVTFIPEHEAIASLAILSTWHPPEGVRSTVGLSRDPEHRPGYAAVMIVMSAAEDVVAAFHLDRVPDRDAIETLDLRARDLLELTLSPDTTYYGNGE